MKTNIADKPCQGNYVRQLCDTSKKFVNKSCS